MISPAASSSALRILRADGTVVGAGFLVDAQHVFTCAHVVAEALGLSPISPTLPNQPILLDFPLLPSTPRLRARVTVWQPVNEDWNGGDIAGLELLDAAPEGAQPVTFAPTTDVWDHDFRAFGFPAVVEKGTWSTGRLLAEQGNGWIQIEDNRSGGVPITQGFSGAAVWDEQLEGVVGMVVATLHDPDGRVGGQAGIRVAFAIPQRLLLTAWPLIQPVTRPRVFLSAAQSDTDRRERLRAELEAGGVLVWDEQHGPVGTPPEAEHGQQAIRAAMALLVITSNSTASSLIVREHLRLAELYQRHIIFIRMGRASADSPSHLSSDAASSPTHPVHTEGTTTAPQTITRGADSSRTNLIHGEANTQLPPQLPTPPAPRWQDEDESDTERKLAEIARQNLNFAWIDASSSSENDYKKTVLTIKEMLLERSSIATLLDALSKQPRAPRNPYVGLRAFTARERDDFFGREAFVASLHAEIVRRLDPALKEKEGRLLTVIGASGSGKSSVVMAGLLPRLQEDAKSESWLYLPRMVPGSSPIEALIDTLSPYFPDASFRRLHEDLTGDRTDGLHRLAGQIARRRGEPGRHVVLFVDQFEELFTQTVSEEERRRFLALLFTAAGASDGALLILLTLRADFYSHLMEYPDFYALLATSLYPLLPLQSSELRAAIARPAAQPDVQLSFEGDLLGDLLFDVQRQAGALPLLQFTLQQLYERRQGNRLTLKAYKEIGEVNGALARYAQATYESLPAEQRDLARILFLRLLEPGSTPEESTRRRASLSELAFSDPDQTRRMQATIDTFISARLLTSSAYPLTGQTTIEVSHEALIRAWPQLADWLRAARDDLPLQHKISEDAAQWQQNNQPPDRLYRGSQLKQARTWATRNILSVSKQEQTFLHASQIGRVRSIAIVILVILLVVASSGIAIWTIVYQPKPDYITNTSDDGIGSLRWAIDNAQSGSTVTFAPELSGKTITLTSSDIHIRQHQLTIRSSEYNPSIINSRNSGWSIIIDTPASVIFNHLAFEQTIDAKEGSFIVNRGELNLRNCLISHNVGSISPISNVNILNIFDSIISNNTSKNSSAAAGGVYNEGHLNIDSSTISYNTASGPTSGGGGIFNSGYLSIKRSTISNNKIISDVQGGDVQVGGGIFSSGTTLDVSNSTISANTVDSNSDTISNNNFTSNVQGGGIFSSSGTLNVSNSTISDNIVDSSDSGGDIAVYNITSTPSPMLTPTPIPTPYSIIHLSFCTIYRNTVNYYGASSIFLSNVSPSFIHMKASIVTMDETKKNSAIVGGTIISEGYNLVQNMLSAKSGLVSVRTTDRLVENMTNILGSAARQQGNDALTATYALSSNADNPAVNAIPKQACVDFQGQPVNTDQRGMPRPGRNKHGKLACDIGAYESSN